MRPLNKLIVERLLGSPAVARRLSWNRKEEERTEEDNEEKRRGEGKGCVCAWKSIVLLYVNMLG